nr:hypothetical protein [Shimia gijangensis]
MEWPVSCPRHGGRVLCRCSGFDTDLRCSGTHAIFVWTFPGHDAATGNPLTVHGWEEWEIGDGPIVNSSRGWFDAEDYARQVEGK